MRRAWKRLAERASNAAFDDAERSEALAEALYDDWSAEVPEKLVGRLRDIFDDARGTLFDELLIKKLEALRGDITGDPLTNRIVGLLDAGRTSWVSWRRSTWESSRRRASATR